MAILQHYNELQASDPESELVHIKADVDRALSQANLSEEELTLITLLFLTAPTNYPTRGKPDKNGGQSGRPPGGTTQAQVAKLTAENKTAAARENKTSRVLRKAAAKLAQYLGEGYE